MLLSFNSLVKTIAPTAAFHNTTRLLVHDFHLSVHNNVFFVDIKHGVGFEELQESVYTVALDCVLSQHLVFLVNALLLTQRCVGFYFRHFRSNVGEDKEFVVVHFFSQPSTTFIRQVNRIHLFINNKVKRLNSFGHSFVVILHVDFFRLEHTSFYARFGEELNERFVFR